MPASVASGSLVLLALLTGCSTAALDTPLKLAVDCRTEEALADADRSVQSDGIVATPIGEIARLVVLRDAGRESAYETERARMLEKYSTMTGSEIDEAVAQKVTEVRADRQRKLGRERC